MTAILHVAPLGDPPWPTLDPFLFCVHHDDAYPAGDEHMGPAASLAGRNIGNDFAGKDGWRMYHGDVVPGFPAHPHRGFETVTLMRRGFIDHADSLGATARFGQGDAQWMTAGKGVVHCEMFPLRRRDGPNPAELFQIWLNLPSSHKMVDPYFTMLWSETIPRRVFRDDDGRETEVVMVAGALDGEQAPPPPPDSWAAQPDSGVAIWTLRMQPGATWTMPAGAAGVTRALYFFAGQSMRIDGRKLAPKVVVQARGDAALSLENGPQEAELLLLAGRPIGEPVVARGPFVMNTPGEIVAAYEDFRRTGFGGWPWEGHGPVHPREAGRFAIHPDGRREEPA